ncbi:hypothetical protein T11_15561 [Trichinella zimbabwensis]|uniref:Uncharacterized protein n=1 Tax=Trichinella zimbabwensis TaxID=268475 RepID=A0A0V1HID8_9BILA|nr:hypothetical protein T11_15561 [Trichinella zimbabwensis]
MHFLDNLRSLCICQKRVLKGAVALKDLNKKFPAFDNFFIKPHISFSETEYYVYEDVLSDTAFAMHIPDMQACFLDSLQSLSVLHSPPTGFAVYQKKWNNFYLHFAREINNSNNAKVQKDDMVLFNLAQTNSIEK